MSPKISAILAEKKEIMYVENILMSPFNPLLIERMKEETTQSIDGKNIILSLTELSNMTTEREEIEERILEEKILSFMPPNNRDFLQRILLCLPTQI